MTELDKALFEHRWRLAVPQLRRATGRLGIHGDEAADVMQDVAIKLLRAGQVGESDAHFQALALNALKWACVDRWRYGNRSVAIDDQADYDSAAARGSAADEAERGLALRRALERLPARQRQALELTAGGHDPSEVAAQMRVTAATARSLLRHAKLRLLSEIL